MQPSLPKSGIGAIDSFLVIARPSNPVIQLDARLLDRVELIEYSAKGPMAAAWLCAGAAAGALFSLVPGGWFLGSGAGILAYERFAEANRRRHAKDLLMVMGDLEVVLQIPDGAAAAKRLVDQLSPYTREAPIEDPQAYRDAKHRLANLAANDDRALQKDAEKILGFGRERVIADEYGIRIGLNHFSTDFVADLAKRGGNLRLPGDQYLQAAVALLVYEAHRRAVAGEDAALLAKRVSAYEAWSGQGGTR